MACSSSSPTKPEGFHPTIFHNLEPALPSILHFAQNIFLPIVSKGLAQFSLSTQCARARKATLQTHFFQKLKIQSDSIPQSIHDSLTPEKIQSLVHTQMFAELYKPKPEFIQLETVLQDIREAETRKDWTSSYFLARILCASKLKDSLYHHDQPSDTAVFHSLPYSVWLMLLQSPTITDHLLFAFNTVLPSFQLELENKIHYATNIMAIYNRIHHNNEFKQLCLAILLPLSLTPEGRKALCEAGGIEFLISVMRAPNDGFNFNNPRVQAKYLLARLMQDKTALDEVVSTEPGILHQMLSDLEGQHYICYSTDGFKYLTHLLSLVPPLVSSHTTRSMIVKQDVKDTTEKIKFWLEAINKPDGIKAPEITQVSHLIREAKHCLEKIPSRHRLSLPTPLSELTESSHSPNHADITRMGSEVGKEPVMPTRPKKSDCCLIS
jgi:hypothetical protein